jgi:xanthine dehydrogenase accessory factor
MAWFDQAKAALGRGGGGILLTLGRIKGAGPRESGAEMIVFEGGQAGSIGGGALERTAALRARSLLAQGFDGDETVTLGLEGDLGDCGGEIAEVRFQCLDAAAINALSARHEAAVAGLPQVCIFGAGHVGRAIIGALEPLPLNVTCIDDRAEVAADVDGDVALVLSADPAGEVAGLPPGALVLVMSHSHELDYGICRAALARDDLTFVGVIGSAAKRARMLERLAVEGLSEAADARLVSPIGIDGIRGREPAVIAAAVAAQLLRIVEAIKGEEKHD